MEGHPPGDRPLSKLLPIETDARRLDRFELVAELATGGMATVYLARLSGVGGFQRFVAIKRLHPHLARETEFIEMFLEEARVAARLHHPNVAPVIEIGSSPEGYYIVMEYVEGDTLGRLLARAAQTGTRLPVKVGLRIVVDMLAGLHAAHELKDDDGRPLGVVHRDVSPQNVLVGVDGTSRLSDFGVARATSKLSTTRSGQLKGKLAYMAPEQAKGAKDIDRRADLFASGTVLWEVLACRRLFKGDGEADTLNRVLNEVVPTVRSAVPTVPLVIDAVVARALERDRDKRYATAAEFSEALERAAASVGALGTHKDVAAHLEQVLGTEISQQREVVRAWLARSEPSQHGTDIPARESTTVTKVEGSDPSRSRPRAPEAPSSEASQPASSVSSVTAAVPGSTNPSGAPPPPPVIVGSVSHRRARALPWAVAAVALVVAGLGWARIGRPVADPTAAPPPPVVGVAPPVAAASAPPSPTTSSPPSAAASASPAGDDAATAAAPTILRPARPARPAQVPVAATPSATASALSPAPAPASVPDDISRNPYR